MTFCTHKTECLFTHMNAQKINSNNLFSTKKTLTGRKSHLSQGTTTFCSHSLMKMVESSSKDNRFILTVKTEFMIETRISSIFTQIYAGEMTLETWIPPGETFAHPTKRSPLKRKFLSLTGRSSRRSLRRVMAICFWRTWKLEKHAPSTCRTSRRPLRACYSTTATLTLRKSRKSQKYCILTNISFTTVNSIWTWATTPTSKSSNFWIPAQMKSKKFLNPGTSRWLRKVSKSDWPLVQMSSTTKALISSEKSI